MYWLERQARYWICDREVIVGIEEHVWLVRAHLVGRALLRAIDIEVEFLLL